MRQMPAPAPSGLLDLAGGGRGTRWGRALETSALLFAAAAAALVVVQSVAAQGNSRDWGWAGMVLLAAALAAAVLFGAARLPGSHRTLLAAAMALSLVLRLGYLLAVETPLNSDFELLHRAAVMLSQGDLTWTEYQYFRNWGYQIPFVAYQALVLRIFSSDWALKLINLAAMLGTNFLLYQLGRLFLSGKAAAAAALLYAVYPGAIHMAPVLTNQHLSLCFLLLGLWLLLSRRGWRWMLLAGACLAVGNLFRPEGVVTLAAVAAAGVVLLARWPDRRRAAGLVLGLAVALAAYFGVQAGTGAALQAAGIAPHGIGNNVPEWKFVVGLDAANEYGDYTEAHADILDIQDGGARRAETWRIIRQSFRERDDILDFFLGKTQAMWAWDEPFSWSSGYLEQGVELLPGVTVGTALEWMGMAERGLALLVWGCLAGTAVLLFRYPERRERGAALVCLLAVCAFFCVYLLIEVQPRYRYSVMPYLFILAGVPVQWLLSRNKRPAPPAAGEKQNDQMR